MRHIHIGPAQQYKDKRYSGPVYECVRLRSSWVSENECDGDRCEAFDLWSLSPITHSLAWPQHARSATHSVNVPGQAHSLILFLYYFLGPSEWCGDSGDGPGNKRKRKRRTPQDCAESFNGWSEGLAVSQRYAPTITTQVSSFRYTVLVHHTMSETHTMCAALRLCGDAPGKGTYIISFHSLFLFWPTSHITQRYIWARI